MLHLANGTAAHGPGVRIVTRRPSREMEGYVAPEIARRNLHAAHGTESSVRERGDRKILTAVLAVACRPYRRGNGFRLEGRRAHLQGLQDMAADVFGVRHSRATRDDPSEQREAVVGILVRRVGGSAERQSFFQPLGEGVVRRGQLTVAPGIVLREAGAVREQGADAEGSGIARRVVERRRPRGSIWRRDPRATVFPRRAVAGWRAR